MYLIFILLINISEGWMLLRPHVSRSRQKQERFRRLKIKGGEVERIHQLEAVAEATNMIGPAAAWLTGIRVPATLVAGSSLSTFYSCSEKELHVDGKDNWTCATIKRSTGLLLITAFLLELLCVFATTVTSTWLLSNADHRSPINPLAKSGLGLLHRELEFEYCACRFLFLQGLFHWVAALGLKFTLPAFKPNTTKPERHLAHFYGRSVLTCLLLMLHYFQKHVAFYDNYFALFARFWKLAFMRLFSNWQPRPILLSCAVALLWTISAFISAFRADFEEFHHHHKSR